MQNGPRPQVITSATTGTDRRLLFEASNQLIQGIDWSPDNRAMVVATSGKDESLWLVPINGSAPTVLFREGSDAVIGSPRWSPDGSRIAFTRTIADTSGDVTPSPLSVGEIWTIALRDRQPQLAFAAPWALDKLSAPAWSPDGKQLSFSLIRSDVSASPTDTWSGTYVVSADGSDLRRLSATYNETFEEGGWGGQVLPPPAWQPLPVP